MKKILSVLIALVFVFGMAMPAMASLPFASLPRVYGGYTVSNRGDYNLTISHDQGQVILGDFEEGENVLTPEQIKSVNFKITGVNNATGDVRVMNQSTIEEMTITLPNGYSHNIINVRIKGRVQVGATGKLDRYTIDIPLYYCS